MLRRDLFRALQKKRPVLYADKENIILHQDNAPAHTASSRDKFTRTRNSRACAVQPRLGADGLCRFSLHQIGRKFRDLDELKTASMFIISRIESEWYINVFNKLDHRQEKCIKCGGEYFEKQ